MKAIINTTIVKRKAEIENLKTKIQDILNMEQTVKRRKKKSRKSLIYLMES